MRIIHLPESARTLIFDLDNTLYSNKSYTLYQDQVLVAKLAQERTATVEETRALLEGMRKERRNKGLGATSLVHLCMQLGYSAATSAQWRAELVEPEQFLAHDPRLAVVLGELSRTFYLALLSNNARLVAQKSVRALGVDAFFSTIAGLEDTGNGKPGTEPFAITARLCKAAPQECISIGDRYDVDLAPALEIGMGAIEVHNVEDVYGLPEALARFIKK